jgi:DNA polymerase elongation subunit (family B)
VIEKSRQKLRILDFDIETRLVGFHNAGNPRDLSGSEPMAIACSWVGEDKISYIVMRQPEDLAKMIFWFLRFYEKADIVTGHYIRKFDLPILSGACMEIGIEPLRSKLVSDTKCDLRSRAGLSMSQENLAGMYELEQSKFHMGDHAWRPSTRLTKKGISATIQRVTDDVRQHKALRERLLADGWLRPPRVWSA